MAWDDDLLPEQRAAAAYTGNHARLLAGPGTGKTLTLTKHICFLVEQHHIVPQEIVAVTFTRAAASELRQRVENILGVGNSPHISTLHSFALRQLLRNATRLAALPQPLRIADDWEERNVIQEDLKTLLGLRRVADARDLLNDLSADWQSLTADDDDWERRFPNPQFLAAWREHRNIYGYSLRAELVYQLKRAMEQRDDFQFEGATRHLLVDEYQDLNRCDLAVVKQIVSHGVELYLAGDDDQSIYGFRKAHPEGIRRFPRDYAGARELVLEVCKRCDQKILDLGLFVARQDYRRIDKTITSEPGRMLGEVGIIRFPDQDSEAAGVARICRHLIDRHGLQPDDILILLRSDRYSAFTKPLRQQLDRANVSTSMITEGSGPLDTLQGRSFLAFLRLITNPNDHLSWRTLMMTFCTNVGAGAIGSLYDLCRSRGQGFAQVVIAAERDPNIIPRSHRNRIARGISQVLSVLQFLLPNGGGDYGSRDSLMVAISQAAEQLINDINERMLVMAQFSMAAEASNATSVEGLIRATEVAGEDIEQEIEAGKVNILTMHRAKGLTAKAVIVVAAEDEYVPGRAQGDAVDDERRLLYVSLTRAKHYLFVTYCDKRIGQQTRTGRPAGIDPNTGKPFWRQNRSLTQFLRDGPLTPVGGQAFILRLEQHV